MLYLLILRTGVIWWCLQKGGLGCWSSYSVFSWQNWKLLYEFYKRKPKQKKSKFEKNKEDGDKSNQAQLEELSENAGERYVDTIFEYWLNFCYWLKNTGFIPSLGFLFLKVLSFPVMPGTLFWGMLPRWAISKLLRITAVTFTGLLSAINITLGHKHKEPPVGTWIWKVKVNSCSFQVTISSAKRSNPWQE